MKTVIATMFFAAALMVNSMAFADADDMKWITQCLKDNADAKVSPDVVTKYCTCMNNKMSSNETQSITQWEKTHPAERKACDKESGWN